jgi:enoyl-CoA hydratase/carnithine racemase
MTALTQLVVSGLLNKQIAEARDRRHTVKIHRSHLMEKMKADSLSALITTRTAYEWGVVAEVVPNGKALSRSQELAKLYLKAPEVTRPNTRVHFIQPLKERIVREVAISILGFLSGTIGVTGLIVGCMMMVQETRLAVHDLTQEAQAVDKSEPNMH